MESAVQTDLTFFANGPGSTLLERSRATLKYAHLLDVIVSYSPVSGSHRLNESLEGVGAVRVPDGPVRELHAGTPAEGAERADVIRGREAEVDRLVYALYGLTPEEVALVERRVGGSRG